jgi:hypothetical protein
MNSINVEIELPGPTDLDIDRLFDEPRRQKLASTGLADDESRRTSWNPEITDKGLASTDRTKVLNRPRRCLDQAPLSRRAMWIFTQERQPSAGGLLRPGAGFRTERPPAASLAVPVMMAGEISRGNHATIPARAKVSET